MLAFPDHEWWSVQSPLKLFEYFAMAKPVIATDIPMNTSVIGAMKCAFLIKNNTPDDICAGIKLAMATKDRLSEMGAEGRSLVEKTYSWREQASKIGAYLQTI
jgi:glycosyltransferase involved in cell wall biosynthesis